MKKMFFALVAMMMVIVFTNTVSAKTIAKYSAKGYTLSVTYKNGKTRVKWNGKTYHTYHGKYKVKIVKESDLTEKKLIKRKGKIIYVELIHGRVINNNLDGKTSNGKYITYKKLRGKVKKGSGVVTLCVYNPNSKWIDDIHDRFDVY